MACEIGRFQLQAPGPDGARANVEGKYLVVWKRDADDAWRLHADIWNTDA